MSRLEQAIRNGNYTAEKVVIDGIWTGEYTYIVIIDGARFQYKERISAGYFQSICDRIRREKSKRDYPLYVCYTARPEHTATMSDIMDAYDDYRMAMAF